MNSCPGRRQVRGRDDLRCAISTASNKPPSAITTATACRRQRPQTRASLPLPRSPARRTVPQAVGAKHTPCPCVWCPAPTGTVSEHVTMSVDTEPRDNDAAFVGLTALGSSNRSQAA